MSIEKSNKQHSNYFKFVLYQGENVINERIFSADQINPAVRYMVDIREIIPSIIQRLQKTLSRKVLNFKEFEYDFLKYYKKQLSLETKPVENKLLKPSVITQNIAGKTIKGVECKFGLYLNDNPIVERKFYVDNYNTACRFSVEITSLVNEICDEILNNLKNNDVAHMWDDYLLINTYGLHIIQIRELDYQKRIELLEKIDDSFFVKKTRNYYKNLQSQLSN